MWAMRIFWSIRISMMHSVKNCIGPRGEIGTPLPYPSKKVKKLFPILVHHKHLMGSVTVEKETLAEQGEIPMQQEEYYDDHLRNFK